MRSDFHRPAKVILSAAGEQIIEIVVHKHASYQSVSGMNEVWLILAEKS